MIEIDSHAFAWVFENERTSIVLQNSFVCSTSHDVTGVYSISASNYCLICSPLSKILVKCLIVANPVFFLTNASYFWRNCRRFSRTDSNILMASTRAPSFASNFVIVSKMKLKLHLMFVNSFLRFGDLIADCVFSASFESNAARTFLKQF